MASTCYKHTCLTIWNLNLPPPALSTSNFNRPRNTIVVLRKQFAALNRMFVRVSFPDPLPAQMANLARIAPTIHGSHLRTIRVHARMPDAHGGDHDAQISGPEGLLVSSAVTVDDGVKSESEPINMGLKSRSETVCHGESKSEEWSERQDSNLRLRGPKPRALAKLSYAPTQAHDCKNFQRCNPIVE